MASTPPMSDPPQLALDGYHAGVGLVVLLFVLKALLPKGYVLKIVKVYAERDQLPTDHEETDEPEAQ